MSAMLFTLPVIAAIFLRTTPPAIAQIVASTPSQTFRDVPPDHPSFNAVEFLASKGVVGGYDDGTFKPDQPVNRAEALKLIIAPMMEHLSGAGSGMLASTFLDVNFSLWYFPYVSHAVAIGIIDTPPKKTHFLGADPVLLAEFLKMLQLAFGINPASDFGDIELPLSTDVTGTGAWFYPYMRYALASSMVTALADGTLTPGKELTRADAAELVFSLLAYSEGIRIPILLQIVEGEVQRVLSHLSGNDVISASYASARAVVAARGALAKSALDKVRGTVKIAEAFAWIVRCVEAGNAERWQDAEEAAKKAWDLAGKARAFSMELDLAASLAQKIATNLADEVRRKSVSP